MINQNGLLAKKFIIAGERRSGTSTLAKWIEVHPQVFLYPKVDQAFFLDDRLRGRMQWMDGHIDPNEWETVHELSEYEALFSDVGPKHQIVGEKSADYFFWEPCLERIQQHLPEVSIVLTLRHPVERAWSHYWNEVGKGREDLSFEEALEAEESRCKSSDYAKLHLSYMARGRYVRSLQRWLKAFDRSQLHLVILEKLIANPITELQKLYEFLGVDENEGLSRAGQRFNHNWTTVPRAFWQRNSLTRRIESNINRIAKKGAKVLFSDPYTRRKHGSKLELLTRRPQKSFRMNQTTRQSLLNAFQPYTDELQQLENVSLDEWRA